MSLFRRQPEPVVEEQEEPHIEELPESVVEPHIEEPPTHLDYPDWEEGSTAPRLFERLRGWGPGHMPPGDPDEPVGVAGDRYAAHLKLWEAVRDWEIEQERLDRRTENLRKSAAQSAAARAEFEELQRRAEEEEKWEVEEHQNRMARLHAAAANHGFTVVIEGERVRLVAHGDHPAVGRLFPWESPPPMVVTPHGTVVARAGEGLIEVEEFIESWPSMLEDATRSNPRLRGRLPH